MSGCNRLLGYSLASLLGDNDIAFFFFFPSFFLQIVFQRFLHLSMCCPVLRGIYKDFHRNQHGEVLEDGLMSCLVMMHASSSSLSIFLSVASSLAFRMDRGMDYRRLARFGAVRRTHREMERGVQEGYLFLGFGQEQGKRNTEGPMMQGGTLAANNAKGCKNDYCWRTISHGMSRPS